MIEDPVNVMNNGNMNAFFFAIVFLLLLSYKWIYLFIYSCKVLLQCFFSNAVHSGGAFKVSGECSKTSESS